MIETLSLEEARLKLQNVVLPEIRRKERVNFDGVEVKAGLCNTCTGYNPNTRERGAIWVDTRDLSRCSVDELEVRLAHERKHWDDLADPDILGKPKLIAEQRAMWEEARIHQAQGNFTEAKWLEAASADPLLAIIEYASRLIIWIPNRLSRYEHVNSFFSEPFGGTVETK